MNICKIKSMGNKEMYHDNRTIVDRHIELFTKFMKCIRKDIHISYRDCKSWSGTYTGDIYYINMWSGKSDEDMIFPEEEKAFGLEFCNDGIFLPREDYKTICNENGIALVEYSNYHMNFLYDVCEFSSEDEFKLLEILMERVLYEMFGDEVNNLVESYTEEVSKIKQDKLVKRIMQNVSNNNRDRERRLNQDKEALTNYRHKIRNLWIQIKTNEALVRAGGHSEESIKTKLNSELDMMKNNKRIKSIDIDEDGKIEFITDDIFINCAYKPDIIKRYYIGYFKVTLDISTGDVKIFNQKPECLDKKYKGDWGVQHPHISEYGNPCLGSATELIADCIDQYRWSTLIDVILSYLESVNIADYAGKNIWHWMEVNKDGNEITGDDKYIPEYAE